MKFSRSLFILVGASAGLTLLSGERDGTCTPTKAQIILREKIAELRGEGIPLPSKDELLADVQRLHREGKISDQQLETFKKNIQQQYAGPGGSSNPEAQARAQQALQRKLTELNKGEPAAPPANTEAQAKAQRILDEQRAAAKNAEAAPPPASTVARQPVQPKPAQPSKEPKATTPPSNTEAQAKAQKVLEELRSREQKTVVTAPPATTETQLKAQKAAAEQRAPVKKAESTPPATRTVSQQAVTQKAAAARTPEKTNVIPQSTTGTLTPELEVKARELLRAQITATQSVETPAPLPQTRAPAVATPTVAAPVPAVAAPAPAVATTAPVTEAPAASSAAQAKALEVLRQKEAELKAGVTSDTPQHVRALRLKIAEERGLLHPGEVAQTTSGIGASVQASPAGLAPLPLPSSNKIGLERLAELTELYRADRITPYQYHHERAKIVATL